jgi:hypothetical protein
LATLLTSHSLLPAANGWLLLKIILKIPLAALLLRNLSRQYRHQFVAKPAPDEGSTRFN